MNDRSSLLAAQVFPPVRSLEAPPTDGLLPVADGLRIRLAVPPAAAAAARTAAECAARRMWGIAPVAETLPPTLPPNAPPEAYEVSVDATGIHLAAPSPAGVRHALETLRQLAEPERKVARSSHVALPFVTVRDEPAFAFRALHVCWFPEPMTDVWSVERAIRIAAALKLNIVILEFWGTYRFRSFPEFGWAERTVGADTVHHLAEVARDLGITLVPQFNILGHASAARSVSCKHAVLDFHPEFAPLFEQDGWSWCLSNPETASRLEACVTELHDAFDRPPYFHLGCDEASGLGTCSACRARPLADLVLSHITRFRDILAARGARCLLWHDMLFDRDDPACRGTIVCGDSRTAPLLGRLPKDLIVCDWQYGQVPLRDGTPLNVWPTTERIRAAGYDCVMCPFENTDAMPAMGRSTLRLGGLGLLLTTWHHPVGHAFFREVLQGSAAAWAPDRTLFKTAEPLVNPLALFARLVRDVHHDMGGLDTYEHAGTAPAQLALP